MTVLHTVCLRPGGMNRGGVRHDKHKLHTLEAFTAAQLREMFDEPEIVLILGGDALSEKQVIAFEAEARAAADAKAAAEAKTAAKSKT